jgi:PIN domain nuclease of toxin-antitoxin system
LSTPNNVENDGKTVEGTKEDTLLAIIDRTMGRDKAKKLRSSSASNSIACLEVLQKMHCDRQVYEQWVEEATSVAEIAMIVQAERKLGIQEEQLHTQQVLQLDQQQLEGEKCC